MSFLDNLDTNLDQQEDFLGGGGVPPLESDIYPVLIKMAYLTKSANGAYGVVVDYIVEGTDQERSTTIYFTNRAGQNYTVDKESGKRRALPGWGHVESIAQMLEGKGFPQAKQEEKQVEIYDFDLKKKVPTTVKVFTGWIGGKVLFGMIKEIANKYSNGAITAETTERNSLDKVFHSSKKTLNEALKKEDAKFYDEWLEKRKGTVNDRTQKVAGNTAPARAPGANAPEAAASAAGDAGDLFN